MRVLEGSCGFGSPVNVCPRLLLLPCLASDDCLGQVLPPPVLAAMSALAGPALSMQVVDISGLKSYNGWYHHQILAARDCYAR